jgi:Tol biopolymer transport system component
LLVSGPVAHEKPAIWMISVIGATLKKLRDDATDASLSPDGLQIVFTDAVTQDICLMSADGGQARVWLTPKAGYLLQIPTWFPNGKRTTPTWFRNGKRILYVKYGGPNGEKTVALESRDLKGGDPVIVLSNLLLTEFCWGRDGRILYAVREPPPNQYDSNLWEQRLNEDTGRPEGVPRRLTDWIGFYFGNPELTADGRRFVFLNGRSQSDIYLGKLANGGTGLEDPRRLTLDERTDWPGGWTADSKTLFLYSDRKSGFDIYRQGSDDRDAEPIVTGPGEKRAPQMSPDGKWLLYMQWPEAVKDVPPGFGKLMRMPISGGPPERVMDFKGHSGVGVMSPASTVGGYPSFRCPSRGNSCVLAEVQEGAIVFTSFDPLQGRTKELVRVAKNVDFRTWDLSPDGSRIALPEFDYRAGVIRILPLDGGPQQTLSAKPWTQLITLAWAADGRSLYLVSSSSRGSSLLRMDPTGNAKLLAKQLGWDIQSLAPSPDGRLLALGAVQSNYNAWTIPSFPRQ